MLKEDEGKGGNRTAAQPRWPNLGGMLAFWEKDVAQCRVAADADVPQAALVATVMEHAPAAYRDLLKAVPRGKM